MSQNDFLKPSVSTSIQNEENIKKGLKFYLKNNLKKQFKENLLLVLTVIAVLSGLGVGFLLRAYTNFNPAQKNYFGFLGEIFLRMLKFLTIPLISTSIIGGIASLGKAGKTGKVTTIAFSYYFSTTILAAILGLILVTTIRPGVRVNSYTSGELGYDPLGGRKIGPVDTILDLIR
jgi:Na+/H+-dicarboxylate symporter